jgi:hypothetical protein
MFKIGDDVKLTKSAFGYNAGAEGVVATIPEPGKLQVDIYQDQNGTTVEPPDPLPPLPEDYFE